MSRAHWTLVNRDKSHVEEAWSTSGDDWSATSRILRGGVSDGIQMVTLQNGDLTVDVLPTRGMGLHAARLGDTRFGWRSPVHGPVHPQWVPVDEPSGLGWLDGFDEWLVRCGLESNGAPEFDSDNRLLYPLHGRVANRPAHRVEVERKSDGRLCITGEVDEVRFHFSKLRLNSFMALLPDRNTVELEETITNLSAAPATAQMLYHTNFGPPLLEDGARLVVTADQVVPRTADAAAELAEWDHYGKTQAATPERVYFLKPRADDQGYAHAFLSNAGQTVAAHIAFDTSTLPYFTLWKNPESSQDGTVTGLEPGTNFPNPRTFETKQGRVVPLAPGASVTFRLRITLYSDAARIAAARAPIDKLAAPAATQLREPPAGWVAE